jgi:hypothetical protein
MQTLRDTQPDQFGRALRDGIEVVGAGFLPASATEFVEFVTKRDLILRVSDLHHGVAPVGGGAPH